MPDSPWTTSFWRLKVGAGVMRMSEPVGTKVIHVYDPAVTDCREWVCWKTKGVYVISREKKNSAAEVLGNNPWDQDDPQNIGVLLDQLAGPCAGNLLRRVTYRDPATGTEYTYLTNLLTLPPGLIAYLYKSRWDVEKVFNEKKNKLMEKKS
jgi:hypothetical protein